MDTVEMGRRRGKDERRYLHGDTYITICKKKLANENLFLCHWELKLGHCNNLEVWDGVAGSFKREVTYVFLWLIHVDLWHKPTQYFKPAIPHLKINKLKKFKIKKINEKISKKNF